MGLIENIKAMMGGHTLAFPGDTAGPVRSMPFIYAGMPQAPEPMKDLYSLSVVYPFKAPLVYACIEKKSEAVCDPEIKIERANAAGEFKPVKDHRLKALLDKPNPYETGTSFRRSWMASECVADSFYFEIVRNRAKEPIELYPLHPGYVKATYKTNERGTYTLDGYDYSFAGQFIHLNAADVLVYRRHGLTSVFAGTSQLQAALGSVEVAGGVTDYIRSFFLNDGTPSGILKVKGRKMTEDEAQGLQSKWMQKFGRGGNQYRSVAVLDEQADYESIGAKLNEAGLGEITEMSQAELCGIFGVPPILVGAFVGLKYVNQRASVREAQADFWDNTISPQLRAWREFLTWSLLPMFEPVEDIAAGRVRVNWDMTQVAALQEDESARHDRARKDYAAGLLTLDESRAYIGLDAAADPDLGGSFIAVPVLDPEMQTPAPMKNFIDPARNAKLNGSRKHSVLFDPQKKTFESDGMTLSREPSELEAAVLDLKAIAGGAAADSKRLTDILIDLREDLIKQSVEVFGELPADADLYELLLNPPAKYGPKVAKIIVSSIERGRRLVAAELRRQGADVALSANIVDLEAIASRLSDLTIARAVNEIQSRAQSQIATQGILGNTPAEVETMLSDVLLSQSDKWTESYSAAAVNSATNEGRAGAMDELSEHIKYYEYSAIMDQNVCGPCAEWDTTQSEDLSDLPTVPNPDCDGADRCRCLIIAIFDDGKDLG